MLTLEYCYKTGDKIQGPKCDHCDEIIQEDNIWDHDCDNKNDIIIIPISNNIIITTDQRMYFSWLYRIYRFFNTK